jgi:hypothetical protein
MPKHFPVTALLETVPLRLLYQILSLKTFLNLFIQT